MPNTVVAVLDNGAGKSTLLRAVSRTLAFQGGALTSGGIHFGGTRLDGLAPDRVVAPGSRTSRKADRCSPA